MEVIKGRWKKNLILKAWQRWRSRKKGQTIAPEGCFSVYVGAQRQKFIVKTEYVNHPLFKMLLDDAEKEYGFVSDGPIWLPCNIDFFFKVLAEMDAEADTINNPSHRRIFSKGYSSFALCSPSRLLCNLNSADDQFHSAYKVLASRLLKVNQIQ